MNEKKVLEKVEDKTLSDLLVMTRDIDEQKLFLKESTKETLSIEITLVKKSELIGRLLSKRQKMGEAIMEISLFDIILGQVESLPTNVKERLLILVYEMEAEIEQERKSHV